MTTGMKYALSVLAAGVLVLTGSSAALAGHPAPIGTLERANVHHTTVNGALTVTNVLRVQANSSVYGHLYAHNGAQVWSGLLVRTGGLSVVSGGIKSDSLDLSGPLQAGQVTVSGNLQAGAISGSSLSLSGGGTFGGALATTGRVSGNGVDAGAGGVTTTGAISGSSLSAGGGVISGGSLTTSGDITSGGKLTASSLSVSGNVDFTGANVTGLSVSNLNLQNATLQSLNLGAQSSTTSPLTLNQNGQSLQLGVDQSGFLLARGLSLGTQSSFSGNELTLNGNGHSSQLGVDVNGNLTVSSGLAVAGTLAANNLALGSNLSVGGTLTVSGPQGLVTSQVQAPVPSGSSAAGPLTLQGSSITLVGNTRQNGSFTIGGGNNLNLSVANGSGGVSASHIISAGDTDVAGTATVTVGTGGSGSASVSFSQPYASPPIITVTAASDPAPGTSVAPKVWISLNPSSAGPYTGFTIHYASSNAPLAVETIPYYYHVIG